MISNKDKINILKSKPKTKTKKKKHIWVLCIICRKWFEGIPSRRTCHTGCAKKYYRLCPSARVRTIKAHDKIVK